MASRGTVVGGAVVLGAICLLGILPAIVRRRQPVHEFPVVNFSPLAGNGSVAPLQARLHALVLENDKLARQVRDGQRQVSVDTERNAQAAQELESLREQYRQLSKHHHDLELQHEAVLSRLSSAQTPPAPPPPLHLAHAPVSHPPAPDTASPTSLLPKPWPKSQGECNSWLKVYVYDFPKDLLFIQYAEQLKRECKELGKCGSHYGGEHLLAQFTLELILHDFFLQSCTRTKDPEEAHLFFVPFYNDIEYRWQNKRPDAPSPHGQAILDILERGDTKAWEKHFRVTGEYWRRRGGEDHILTLAAPVTGFRHPKGARGWTHYMVQLAPPIFLSLELTRSFIHEYPHCSGKNIVVPYPIPGRDWHNGVWKDKAARTFGTANITTPEGRTTTIINKPIFAYYTGGNHGCVNVRSAIGKEVMNDERCLGQAQRREFADKFKRAFPRDRVDLSRGPPRQVSMSGAQFCACPEGDSPSAKRQYDAVVTGCIPVLVSNDAVYAFSTENQGSMDPDSFSLRVSEESVVAGPGGSNSGGAGLLAQLEKASPERVASLQAGVEDAAWHYRYYSEGSYPADPLLDSRFPDGGATAMLIKELERRVGGGRAKACATERMEPHYFLRFQYCGAANVAREVGNLERALHQKQAGLEARPGDHKLASEIKALQKGIDAYRGKWISR